MIFTVQVNFEIDIEAENENEADSIARYWEVKHPQHREPGKQSIFVEPEYVVVAKKENA